MEVLQKVQAIIADKAGVSPEEVKPETNLKDELDLDSLDKMEILMEVEKQFNIMTDDDEYESVQTVADVVTIVESKIS